MGRRNSKDREDEQCLSGETVTNLPDELWDHYSGLPNPSWYEEIDEKIEDGE